jgi:hypothetical protein
MNGGLVSYSDAELLTAWTELEARRCRLVSDEHALINETTARGIAHARGMRSTAVLAHQLLRITPAEARARVRAAEDLGPRRGLTGEPLPPIYPLVAAAQAEGAISAAHAAAVTTTVESLPSAVRAELEDEVEADLVEQCRRFDPRTVALLGHRILAVVNPDGTLNNDERHRLREFRFTRRADGSAFGRFSLDAECAEHVAAALAPLAAPKPATRGTPGTRDLRSTTQRWHDALLEICKLAMRAQLLPSTAGVTTTVVLHGTRHAFETGRGLVRTGTGALIPASEARRWASSDSRFLAAIFDTTGRLVSYNSCTRLFTEAQRLAMAARDKGCSFPGCTAPPAWCQAHHIEDWVKGGPTSVENGTLLCGFHHREFAALGWTCVVINGIVHWIAPDWLDPDHTPHRNTAHDPVCIT